MALHNVHYYEREFETAIPIARWFKVLALRMPVQDWAEAAHRMYRQEMQSVKAEEDPLMSPALWVRLFVALQEVVRQWADGTNVEDLREAFKKLLVGMGAENANYGGQLALGSLGISASFDLTNPAALARLEALSLENVLNIQTTTNSLISRALIRGVEQGLDMDATARLVRTMASQEWPNLAHGRARLIANTEVCRATSWASRETYSHNGIVEMQWEASMDDKTCDVCSDFHGGVISTEGSGMFESTISLNQTRSPGGWSVPHPPAHPGCRCTVLPVIPAEWERPVDPWTGSEYAAAA